MNSGGDEILFERRGCAGLVTLNRPQALNAVTLTMVRALSRRLRDWAADPGVTRVVLRAAGDRAFSAGGDIRALYDLGRAGRFDDMLTFWREEYALNAFIKAYPKPFVSLIDGIVMGGGVGLSVHGSHRIAGDRYRFAMPEVGIGFFPDVGATWFLPRLPGQLGACCALTGERFDAGDGLHATLATHRVASYRLVDLLDALCGNAGVDDSLRSFHEPAAATGTMTAAAASIARLFKADRVEDILEALDRASDARGDDAGFARRCAATIRSKSPTSLKLALAQVRAGGTLSFAACMNTEFRIVSRIIHGRDFYEGVRAVIVDKDNDPRWQPDSLAAVGDDDVARHFAPLPPEQELGLS